MSVTSAGQAGPRQPNLVRAVIIALVIAIPLAAVGLEYIGDVDLGIRRTIANWGARKYVGTWKTQALGNDVVLILDSNHGGQLSVVAGDSGPVRWEVQGEHIAIQRQGSDRLRYGRVNEDGKTLTYTDVDGSTLIFTRQ